MEIYLPGIKPYLKALRKINSRIWELEYSIRMAQDEELGYEEIGRRACRIRDANAHRIRVKNEITRKFGAAGLPDNTVNISFHGTAGNSFGAFIPKGLTLRLYGDANDYVGKGLSGGRVIVRPDEKATFPSELNVIAGNVIGYGATSGQIFIRGRVGERFCVRNSGAIAVVEGIGDHGCEYMTGGIALVLGRTGRNFAAGMSGGRAFVLDLDAALVNTEFVDVLALPADQEIYVRDLLSNFEAETGSVVAAQLLKNWDENKKRISMIMPRDYARVLAAMDRAEREGLPVDKVVMEAVNG
jgi:glutamate synthase (NADPH/NADH) large chain